ncbi:hypothetical protein E1A91_A05G243900v1 [Gossypium mustelinum]|uniref:Uncharacterized protein n=1 Tax=Gossypium mustelinum TaxID=34275 RepID=A0A5D2ZBJ0_GOSMU|nr:hypothetical protein E1A91_A05G243900v1 [Gossypium mustelinum]TYJ35541.1 hypothetical protein E1A91_A05G243900v1 [Gossypium mustelinum]TYJ35542.1 hypothetical protein E1A91_A05G243900v1 [Gossypium mustelinum]TYJ35543.1 hypothetical protein E1A91_A05G243900v1 [Gossypium mustelinum]
MDLRFRSGWSFWMLKFFLLRRVLTISEDLLVKGRVERDCDF